MQIDLNADLGEGFGAYRMGEDEALIGIISSANVACGFHAGDPLIMNNTAHATKAAGVDLGAHVGFPDLLGFGRRQMQVDPKELASYVVYQLGALAGMAAVAGHRLTHMSFHGALGNMAAADETLAEPLVAAVAAFDRDIIISSSSSQAIESAAARHGLRVATTFLADRAYDVNGLLVPRRMPNSVITDHDQVMLRLRQLLEDGSVTSYSGERIPMRTCSILLHGDTPGAAGMARDIRSEIERGGGEIVPISHLLN
ncbi:LamB/YcsF family protein [Halotalea alkalilenta]|uniref:5-oxoprolinase subunit A n=1 Tax=Halotalea alkalilenta TaxID=376489 RepID=A0A172YG25_9GAMM|nr:5-oxoprolinase subunit PxpA [Halotalea alkalilenta]ANF58173.1 hypothetical protein A5892_12435 [Halotalea alkalilenta]